MSPLDARRVEVPFLFREHERTQLVAADRSMAACLVFEVDLRAIDERPEDDEVARRMKRVQTRELAKEDVRVVVPRQQRLELLGCELGAAREVDIAIAVAGHDESNLAHGPKAVREIRVSGEDVAVAHAVGALRKVEMREAAGHG